MSGDESSREERAPASPAACERSFAECASVTLGKPMRGPQPSGGTRPLEHAGEPGGADPPALLVGDRDVVRGDLSAQVNGGGDAGDHAGAEAAVVRRGNVDADRDAVEALPGVQGGANRA